MLYFGGRKGDGSNSDELWELSFQNGAFWRLIPSGGEWPQARRLHAVAIDDIRGDMWMFGGYVEPTSLGDLWKLDADADDPDWEQIHFVEGPLARYGHGMVYDPLGDRLLMFGGWAPWRTNEVWEFSLSSYQWRQLNLLGESPSARAYPLCFFDISTNSLLVAFGDDGYERDDIWKLQLGSSTGVPETGGTSGLMSIPSVWPNPARSSVHFVLELSRAANVTVFVCDVLGRVVRLMSKGDLTPGAHHIEWDRRDESGREVASGKYFIVARSAVGFAKKEVVVLF
jgi:hypothetical protein